MELELLASICSEAFANPNLSDLSMGRSRYQAGDPRNPPSVRSSIRGNASSAMKRSSNSNPPTSADVKKPKQGDTAGCHGGKPANQRPIDTEGSMVTTNHNNHRPRDTNRSTPAPQEPIEVVKDVKRCKKPVFHRACVTHFSHSHPLRPMEAKVEEELICSGCGLDLSGQSYKCSKSSCNFLLHRSCLSLDRVLQHECHKKHPLALLASPPNKENYSGVYVCSACNDPGTGFVYHCSDCEFDLHVGCALLPTTVEHVDHQIWNHYLKLHYSIPKHIEEAVCDVCSKVVPEEQWMYFCTKCRYCTHLYCTEQVADEEEADDESDGSDDEDVVEVEDEDDGSDK